ncbi:MAG: right-handed parallel beta-helix repeat-containing protein [Armatimonadetes bacterium]|nr:right-handed parallel beta-helix repeat-containing protein [Armatimonadota bacterium]
MRVLVGLALLAAVAGAETFHIAPGAANAADTNAGTAAAPWQTLARLKDLQPGDTVLLHAGVYRETAVLAACAQRGKQITLARFADDAVLSLPAEPGQVLVDGKPARLKVHKLAWDNFALEPVTDADEGVWSYDAQGRQVVLNLGGPNPGEGHRIEIPVRGSAVRLGAGCRVQGIRAQHLLYSAIEVAGDDCIVEDCVLTGCGAGIRVTGWDCCGAVVRRNTVLDCLGNGITLQDRPTGCRVEDNLVARCTLNPWHGVGWLGSVKMNSASDSLFAHNVVLEAGNPATVNGWDGWALWGDINIVRVVYQGNVTAHNKEAGIYVEYAMGDTRAYFNASYRDGHGITCRQSQRGVFMHNYVESARTSGLAVWGAPPTYPTADHVFAHNLVRNCEPSLRLQIEQPQYFDYNHYQPKPGALFADGEKGRKLATLDDVRRETGHELHGVVRDKIEPADAGLDLVTFRVPEAADPTEVLGMVGNGGCEYEDPCGVNLLPYFWRAGTGDGAEHTFLYAAYCGLPGGCEGFAYPGCGGTVCLSTDPKLAHSGVRCLELKGIDAARLPPAGLGFWSPRLPCRPGDTFDVSFWARGQALRPANGSAVAAFALFTDALGGHATRVELDPAVRSGDFGWTQITSVATVPAEALRVAFFFGLRPCTGALWLDDLAIQVR